MPQACQICHNSLFDAEENGDFIVAIKVCGHCFHNSCVLDWIVRSATCPQCRQECQQGDLLKVFLSQQEDYGAFSGETIDKMSKEKSVKRQAPPVPDQRKLYPGKSMELDEERKQYEDPENAFNKGWKKIEELVTDTVESWNSDKGMTDSEKGGNDVQDETTFYTRWKQIENLVTDVSRVAINSWNEYNQASDQASDQAQPPSYEDACQTAHNVTQTTKPEEHSETDFKIKSNETSFEKALLSPDIIKGWTGGPVLQPKTEMERNFVETSPSGAAAASVATETASTELSQHLQSTQYKSYNTHERRKGFKELIHTFHKEMKSEIKAAHQRRRALEKQQKSIYKQLEREYEKERAALKVIEHENGKQGKGDWKLNIRKLDKEHKIKMKKLKLDHKLEMAELEHEVEKKVSEISQKFNTNLKELRS